jgi:glucose 1-dehydrogenase
VCLAGVSSGQHVLSIDAAALNNEVVLQNKVVFGTVNANRRHYDEATRALAKADPEWLDRLITRRVPVGRWSDAYEPAPGDVKTVLQFAEP